MISIDDDAFIVRRPLLIKGLRVAAPTTGSGSFVMVNELFWRGRRWAQLRWALSRFWEEDPDAWGPQEDLCSERGE